MGTTTSSGVGSTFKGVVNAMIFVVGSELAVDTIHLQVKHLKRAPFGVATLRVVMRSTRPGTISPVGCTQNVMAKGKELLAWRRKQKSKTPVLLMLSKVGTTCRVVALAMIIAVGLADLAVEAIQRSGLPKEIRGGVACWPGMSTRTPIWAGLVLGLCRNVMVWVRQRLVHHSTNVEPPSLASE